MGRGFVKYDLPDSGSSAWVLFSAFLDYRLDDGSKLHVEQQPAWCRVCGSFVAAELLQPAEDIEREIGRLQPWIGDRQPRRAGQRKRAEESLAEHQRRLRWRRDRVGPPRCLQCSSVEVVPIPGSGEFAHPATGERVISASSGFADTDLWFAEFSPEGERLAEPGAAPDPAGM
jgi:hypothetical protein